MANTQIYRISDPDWATSAEIVLNEPDRPDSTNLPLSLETQHPVRFAVFAVSTPEGRALPELDAKLSVLDTNLRSLELGPYGEDRYLSPDQQVAILLQPQERGWYASVDHGRMPVALCAMAFHPAPGQPAPRLRCRVCRSTAKALALAIAAAVAAAGAGIALPAALIAAVGAFLGVVGSAAAAAAGIAFINSVVGDAASVIADKLCVAAGLCP